MEGANIYLQQINKETTAESRSSSSDNYHNWFGVGGQLKADKQGEFDFGSLGGGKYRLFRRFNFEHPGGSNSQSIYLTSQTIEIASGQQVFHEIKLKAGHTIKGRTLNTEGTPMADCLVILTKGTHERHYAARSAADGTFRNLPRSTGRMDDHGTTLFLRRALQLPPRLRWHSRGNDRGSSSNDRR